MLRAKTDPLFEVWCQCCYERTRDYRIVDLKFKCEFCISKEEAASMNNEPADISDEDWEKDSSTFYRPPNGGENAA